MFSSQTNRVFARFLGAFPTFPEPQTDLPVKLTCLVEVNVEIATDVEAE
jgi:hypothetical protein